MEPHHKEIKKLSDQMSFKLLEANHYGHLGCEREDEVYVVPISYVFEDGYIYCHSRPGKKVDIMRDHHYVCLQVEEVEDFFHWKSAIAWGYFEELRGYEATRAMRMLVNKLSEAERKRAIRHSTLEVDMSAQLETSIIYRIRVQKVTGCYEDFASEDVRAA